MKLFVGGLASDVTDAELMQEFSAFGKVNSAEAVVDRYSGTPRGFGFVEMPTKSEALAAIDGLNGKEWHGRTLEVNEARPRPPRPQGGGPRHGDNRRGKDKRPGRDRRRY